MDVRAWLVLLAVGSVGVGVSHGSARNGLSRHKRTQRNTCQAEQSCVQVYRSVHVCVVQEGGVTQVLTIINGALACTCRMVAPRASARYIICTFTVINKMCINLRTSSSNRFLFSPAVAIANIDNTVFFFAL